MRPSFTIADKTVVRFNSYTDHIDFTTLHNILYYIYTGSVNLILSDCHQDTRSKLPEGFPEKPDPFNLYRNAERFELTGLKDRCYSYLSITTTQQNVVQRLYHFDCCNRIRLITLFLDYFLRFFGDAEDQRNVEPERPKLTSQYSRYRMVIDRIVNTRSIEWNDLDGKTVFFEMLESLNFNRNDWDFVDDDS